MICKLCDRTRDDNEFDRWEQQQKKPRCKECKAAGKRASREKKKIGHTHTYITKEPKIYKFPKRQPKKKPPTYQGNTLMKKLQELAEKERNSA